MISCFQLKLCVKYFSNLLKGFKLKKMVIETKTAQPVELDEEPVESQLNRLKTVKKTLYLFQNSCSIG